MSKVPFEADQALVRYFVRYPDEWPTAALIAQYRSVGSALFDRSSYPCHFTASSWIVDPERQHTLLIFHGTLRKWLQPGGHPEGQTDLPAVALREAREETGLSSLSLVSSEVFDFDIVPSPVSTKIPPHAHLDVRFLFVAHMDQSLVESDEIIALRWFSISEIPLFHSDRGVLRMAAKTGKL
jgi:8-oxo-dGTP pyrophosphatase MutT (NUDIX family)